MIKLKFTLDPKDKTQMLALSSFAGTLAGAGVSTVRAAAPATVEAPKEEPAPTDKTKESEEREAETPKAPKKRKRRTQAEIAAEIAADKAAENEGEDESEDAEEQDAEEQGGVSTAERNGKNITLDDIRAAVAEKKDKHFAKMKAELQDRYGVATTPKLPVQHYAAFFDFVNGLK